MENNWNGFYDLSSLSLMDLKELFKESLEFSTTSYVDYLKGFSRQTYNELKPSEYIDELVNLSTHNVFIDRYQYNRCADWARKEVEIGSSTYCFQRKLNLYLFIYIDLNRLDLLVEKYKLSKKL